MRDAAAVGANGAGKTNFFHGASPRARREPQRVRAEAAAADTRRRARRARAAIRFVLSDLFSTMRAEDRQSLLHVRGAAAAAAALRRASALANSAPPHSGFLPPVVPAARRREPATR